MIRDWNLDGKINWVDHAAEYEAFRQTMYGTYSTFDEEDGDTDDFWNDCSDDDDDF